MDEGRKDEPFEPASLPGRSRGSLIIFLLVALALVLAIGFFYMTKERDDRRADALMKAAGSVDSAAHVVGHAAKNAADALRNQN
ncbi:MULTISPECIES: hypothetical protein [Sphingobium]|jgi:hypothetical protein|uniref:Uncharacterized protein n=2 Tax=Sphingobium fuliginis (strain ATCC 27551) TaxID=336203 RepID=A0A292ZE30_SPHSA|nr:MULTISPECIES: hypothetical protein [Sphingobium]OAP32866.1 hypothetical protein A8O16_05930 [Sphingobium sp. 20006FA]KXU32482.1 hypothetical protein AXW74_06995 [Sphingobium sp. AM]KYC32539.1 hypothetical protein A0J57_09695 [Sphingobium sp. 22B]MCB4860750.1 hypothetical protein [Sphingobium sp. PNB]PNQ04688.1 hypothetical protein A8G00_00500 [Sphingobium sp. SA916]